MTEEPNIVVSEAGFEFPVVEVLTGRGVIFGKSGSGKSNSVGVIAEELLSQGFPLCIVDADGEHYGLKEEYELLHVGGDESVDVQVTPDHAEALAEVMLYEDVPVILDISGYIEESEAEELVERVSSKLFSLAKMAKKPFPIFVEEIHEAVPETTNPDSLARTLIRVAKRGRKHGLGILGASQRPAEVKKSFVTQATYSIWHKLEWSQDTDVVRDVIDREHAEAVQDLDTGQAIIQADWMDEVRTVQFRQKHTFDAGATPGLDSFETPELKGVSDEIVSKLESITEEKLEEEDERAKLESEVEELRAEKRDLEAELDELRSGETVESEEVERLQDRVESLRTERDELSESLEEVTAERDRAQASVEKREERIEELDAEVGNLRGAIEYIANTLESVGEDVEVDTDTSELRDRIEELEDRNAQLEDRLEAAADAHPDETPVISMHEYDYVDFLEQDAVQEAIEEAKSETTPKYVQGVVASIVDEGGPVPYDDVASRLGLSHSNHVSGAATTLETLGVVEKVDTESGTAVDFNIGGIEDIVAAKQKRERTEEIMDQL